MEDCTLQVKDRAGRTRRRLSIGLCLGLLGSLTGCSGSSDDPPLEDRAVVNTRTTTNPPTTDPKTPTVSWDVTPNKALALSAGATFDLASTLPSSVPPGGRFEVDASGAPLPAGIALLPSGLLTVDVSATGSTAGVVFRYTPPA